MTKRRIRLGVNWVLKNGESTDDVANNLKVSQRRIQQLIKQFKETGEYPKKESIKYYLFKNLIQEVSMNKIILLIVAVSLLLLVSGCMSPTTTSTPTPIATSTETTTAVATETPFAVATETPVATSTAIATGTPMGTATWVPTVATTGTPVSTIAPVSTATSTATANATAAATTATINITSYPTSVQGEANFTIQWQVTGGSPGTISNTSILWGFNSSGTNMSGYPRSSAPQAGSTPQSFSATLTAPSGGGPVYVRAHAVVDGVDIYSPEQQITIIPLYTSSGGGY